jgi:hypothetical protein
MNLAQSYHFHLAAVAALAICIYWSEPAGGPYTPAPARKKAVALARLLSPELEPAPKRNPFERTEPVVSRTNTSEPAQAAAPTEAKELNLVATLISPGQRLALINDRFYAEGDPVTEAANPSAPFKVGTIQANRVVLTRDQETRVLEYRATLPNNPSKSQPQDSGPRRTSP